MSASEPVDVGPAGSVGVTPYCWRNARIWAGPVASGSTLNATICTRLPLSPAVRRSASSSASTWVSAGQNVVQYGNR